MEAEGVFKHVKISFSYEKFFYHSLSLELKRKIIYFQVVAEKMFVEF